MTRDEAIKAGDSFSRVELHAGPCTRRIGPRGGTKEHSEVWRTNGKCQTWKTRPEDFRLPIKYGFNGPYSEVTPRNADLFHTADACILRTTEGAV